MKINCIQIDGYRSFAPTEDRKTYFTLDANIIALIGKNGVGKTNAIEALSRLAFFTDYVENVIPPSAVNQNTGAAPKLVLHAELDDKDIEDLGAYIAGDLKRRDVTYVWEYDSLLKRTRFSFAGAFCEILQCYPILADVDKELKNLAGYLANNVQLNAKEHHALIEALLEYDSVYVSGLKSLADWGLQHLLNYVDAKWKDRIVPLLETFRKVVPELYGAFMKVSPHVCKFDDAAEFPDEYRMEDVNNTNSRLSYQSRVALDRFLGAIGSSRQDLNRAFEETNGRLSTNLRGVISNATRRLSREFNKWYMDGASDVELDIGFDGRVLKLSVNNNGMPGSVRWSDANAGMRWYFSAFLEFQRALRYRNVIILVDEPANHLHVNAQREALSLLQHLAKETRYVIYTTHSPFMIDSSRLCDVRAVVREGNVSAIRPITAVEDVDCRHEALTPVFHSIGCSLAVGLVPNAERTNVIVEGITDYLYLNAMMDVLGMKNANRFYFIPCQGAPSVPYVVPLFIGWGLPFKVLLDGDDEGANAYHRIKNEYGHDVDVRCICYHNGRQIENLISAHDYGVVCGDSLDKTDFKKAKTVKARRFAAMVKSGELIPDQDTRVAFAWIFDQLSRDVERHGEVYLSDE